MSTRYIPQIDNQNFVYPNYDLPEYDQNIIHTINDNSVSGTITNFTGITVTTTGLTFTHDWSWSKNGAEPFITSSSDINLLSVHMLAADQNYFKPWRCIDLISSGVTGSTTYSGNNTITVTPTQMGISEFKYGTYYFEFRFIGSKSIYPICYTYSATTLPTPTPTPTITPTPTVTPTLTPTPTPTGVPAGQWTSGATINVTDTGYIRYLIKGDTNVTYHFFGSLGTTTITDCLDCSTINTGFPFADPGSCTVINCGSVC